ncbi:unnamed protein product, partial [Eruca vesicaria subsp. sativa]|nr:unnamed protein product [Eruca vesicaria subsp. sativa]
MVKITGYCFFSVVVFHKLKDTNWFSRQDTYVFLQYSDSYHRNSSLRWSSCSESVVAAGWSLRHRVQLQREPREATMVK